MKILPIALIALLGQGGARGPAPAPTAQSQQSQAAATASVEGIVVKFGTNEPISGADVELTRIEGPDMAPGARAVYDQIMIRGGLVRVQTPPALAPEVQSVQTGADGKFEFRNLKPGGYRLVAARIGGQYNPAEYGQHDPRGRGLTFPISAGQAIKGARLEMTLSGVITGRVFDAEGIPMGHAMVTALELQYHDGRRTPGVMQIVYTDERGDYRLFWLSPGLYYVTAERLDPRLRTTSERTTPPGMSNGAETAASPVVTRRILANGDVVDETYALVYHNGVLDLNQARLIDLRAGGTSPGADIRMAAGKMLAHHIRGVVVNGVTGQPAKGAAIRAVPRQWSPHVFILDGVADANGAFDLSGAVPGSYAVFATTTGPSTTGMAAILAQMDPTSRAAAMAPIIEDAAKGNKAAQDIVDSVNATPGAGPTIGYLEIEVANADTNALRMVTTSGTPVSGRVLIEGRPQVDNDPNLGSIFVSLVRDPDILGMLPLPVPPPPAPGRGGRGAGVRGGTIIFGLRGAPAGPAASNGQPSGNGSFPFLLFPGDFRVNVSGLPPNTYVKSIRVNGADVLTNGLHVGAAPQGPVEVVLGSDGGEVSGVVRNDKLEPLTNAVVALVPDSPALRVRYDLYKNVTTDASGKFQIQTIVPGSYKLFSWEYVDANAWQNAQFIQPYETLGKPVSIQPGTRQETSVTIIPVRR